MTERIFADCFERVEKAVEAVLAKSGSISGSFPRVGLVLGSGLGALADQLEDPVVVPYAEIPGFPLSTLQSHAGKLILGSLAGCPVACMSGRVHLYEGYTAAEVCLGVRVLALLGTEILLVSNAAGGLNPNWQAGELMLISDHINATGQNPLTGPNREEWGPRYPDMSQAYCPDLREMALEVARKSGLRLNLGVYAAVAGPSLETPAETRALRFMGADAVGMSTVLEVIAARHMGLRVLGVSCLTNKNLPDCMTKITEEEIIRIAGRAGQDLAALLTGILKQLSDRQRRT